MIMKMFSPLSMGIALFGIVSLSSCKQEAPVEDKLEEMMDELETRIDEELDSLAMLEDSITAEIEKEPLQPIVPPPPPEPIDPIPEPEPGPLPPIWDPVPEPPIEEEIVEVPEFAQQDEIFDIVEVQAEYPGGEAAMFVYISKNIVYPQEDLNAGKQGRVYVQFVVEKDGAITTIRVLRGVSEGIDKEAKRVIRRMPKWKPAEHRGKPVRSRMTLPISFRLD